MNVTILWNGSISIFSSLEKEVICNNWKQTECLYNSLRKSSLVLKINYEFSFLEPSILKLGMTEQKTTLLKNLVKLDANHIKLLQLGEAIFLFPKQPLAQCLKHSRSIIPNYYGNPHLLICKCSEFSANRLSPQNIMNTFLLMTHRTRRMFNQAAACPKLRGSAALEPVPALWDLQ